MERRLFKKPRQFSFPGARRLWVLACFFTTFFAFGQNLTIDDIAQAEGSGGSTNFIFTVSRGDASIGAVTFDVNTVGGTATSGVDFTAIVGGTGTIPILAASTTITVSVTGDVSPETTEAFSVVISNPTVGAIADDTGIGTILDDDQTISISDVTLAEGNAGQTAFNFTVSVDGGGAALSTISFGVNTANGTATAGSGDYDAIVAGAGQITVGQTSGTVTVQVNGDTTPEPNETFTVNLSTPTNATINDGSGLGTITNDDAQTISISDVTQAEGNAGTSNFIFTVSVDGGGNALSNIGFTVNTANGTATAGSDYVAISGGSGTITAGTNSITVPVTVNGDTTPEGNETFTVNLSAPTNATINDGSGLGTINNDDSQSISISDVTQAEGNAGTSNFVFTVSVDGGGNALSNIGFTVNTANGTATAGSDYVAISGGSGTITAGTNSITVPVTVNGDTTAEPNETFTVTLSAPTNATINDGSGVGTITNDDSQTISISDVTQAEGNAGTSNFVFTVSVDGGGNALSNIGFTVNTANGTAAAGTDYVAIAGGSGTILAGTNSITVPVTVNGDTTPEANETFTVNLSAPTNATINDGSGLGTITNDDSQTININNVTQAEGSGGGTTAFNFTVSIQGGGTAIQNISFRVDTGNGTANEPSDYTQINNQLFTILAGQSSVTVPVSVVADNVPEEAETFTVQISNATNGTTIGTNTGTGTIQNDDLNAITIDNVSQNEGNSGTTTFTFTVDVVGGGDAVADIQFTINTQNGTATLADGDYVQILNAIGTIAAGNNSTDIDVTVNGDTKGETDETFTVVLSSPTGATIAQGTGTGTIQNDDLNSISIADVFVSEGDAGTSLMTFDVTVDDGVNALQEINFEYDTSNGTATAGQDYVAVNGGNGTIAEGTTGTTVTVTINGDNAVEPNETLTVTLSNINGADGGDTEATGTIQNDDACNAGANAPLQDGTQTTTFCTEDTIPPLTDFVISNPPATTELTFSRNPDPLDTAGHLIPAEIAAPTAGTYYVFYYDSANGCASPVLELTIVRNETPLLDSFTDGERCGPGIVTLTASGSIPNSGNAPDLNWYDAPTGGTLVFTGPTFEPNLTVTTTFYVEAFANGCNSSPRQAVEAFVAPLVVLDVDDTSFTSACSVAANGPAIRDLDDKLTAADAGAWTIEAVPAGATVTIDAGNVVNFEGQPAGTYSFRYTTSTAQAPCVDETVVVDITVTNCDVDTDGDGLLDGLEATIGTNPNLADTDGDGIDDGTEVGPDTANPLNEDGDAVIDALESDVEDADLDGVSDQQDPANLNPCVPNPDNVNCVADLGVTKTVDLPQAVLGQEIVFTITLDNFSPIPMQSIEVGDLLESGFEFVSATASVGTYNEATGIWTVDNIAADASETLELTVNVLNGDSYSNTAELLSSDPVDGNPDNDSSTVTVEIVIPEDADISVSKVAQITPSGSFQDDRISPVVNDRIRFVISVTNESADASVSNIQVLDLLNPESETGFEFVQHTYIQGTFPQGAYDPDTGIWNIDNLDPGETVQLSIVAFVRREGEFTNSARIISPAADADTSNNEDSVLVVVNALTEADPGFIFNQFSPNGDGVNDFLRIRDIGTFENTSIQIFNRYGQLIYEASNMTDDSVWDGTYKNEQAPEGTYFYILELGADRETEKGWIQLIR